MAIFIPEDKIKDIKNTVDIVEIISEVVLLKKAGKNYIGLCPFHSEKTPSFTVSPEKQIFYCFGCGTGGNVFSFLMKHDGLSFPETARMLARRYGIELPTQNMSLGQKKRVSEREGLLAVNKEAMDFFRHALLVGAEGKKARSYLNRRGMTKAIIESFNLGYAPAGWGSLVNLFSKKRMSHSLAEKAGLIISRKDKTGYYDRFRDRIIFPIFDVSKQVIGFGGRVMDDSMPKYLNSPETPVYNKSRSLYGLHMAKKMCREKDTVYIVEGYFDLLSLFQHGIENAVATLGTSLTAEHIRLLKGYAARVILVYDSDEAGIKAALRSIGIFMKEDVDARIIVLPEGYDPDSFLLEYGSESFVNAADRALAIMPFLMDSAIKKHGLSTEGKIRIISELQKPLSSIEDKVDRSLYIKELSERISIDEAAVIEKVRQVLASNEANERVRQRGAHVYPQGSRGTGGVNVTAGKAFQEKGSRIERQIIAMMLQFPEILPEIDNRHVIEHFEDKTLRSIGQIILEHKGFSDVHVSEIMALMDDKEKRRIVASLAIGDDYWDREGCLRLIAQFESSISRRENTLLKKIKAAEDCNDHELLFELLRKKQIQARKQTL